ncbi:MAG TPA: 30S ribosomal protein S3 [Candidatus Saccharimonadales bacterium]|nr:30S ribosomal protein S3 [Candidatus Saccharimonadales bacterium]
MGQKINPHLLRLGPVYNWSSRWFDDKKYKETLLEDYKLRKALMERLRGAGVATVEIERSINSIKLSVYVSRPGMVIGRAGTGIEELKKYVNSLFVKMRKGKAVPKLDIKVEPIKQPNLDAFLVARNIADQLTKRLPFKRILGQNADRAMEAGAKGVRIVIAGRIGGSEIGRREKIQRGTVPLSTIREHIEFASVPSLTKKGYIGVKVWINKGDE